ncbi:interactor of constitutive active ROPs 4-like [Impatiens glandulifera]|uniref:interactor of constitutive active ROPs 4-like n=1 Tax=Impatiens glandulifera TaxID=253017 RepID=UPI001FB12580|nr:interactor of constitutive active ROPs 4-like [Impatiens glandulifera]
MSGSRGSEMIRRQSLRGPKQVKTPTADSENPPQKPITERSPKMGDRRSPRGNAARSSDPKKLGNRVADLESQLGQAQGELKILKHQLSSTGGAAKRVPIKPKNPVEGSDESQPETDVFEVPVEMVLNKVDLSPPAELDNEITSLKAVIDEKETEMEKSKRKKNVMKNKIDELNSDMGLVRTKETEMSLKVNKLFDELEQSKSAEAELKEKLEKLEAEKNSMEAEMKMMRVQMEQWKKAAEAAAIVLSEEAQNNGNKGIDGESPADDDMDDDGFSGGKKKGSGIRKFGEMWKKKGQK